MSIPAATIENPAYFREPVYTDKGPIVSIIEGMEPSVERVKFCFEIAQRTLSALRNREYARFDAQTTSNCCHGMALMVRELINVSRLEPLDELSTIVEESLNQNRFDPNTPLPQSILDLCQLYILDHIREVCPEKGVRSCPSKLKTVLPLGTTFFTKLVKTLQPKYSNRVAFNYEKYLDKATVQTETCGAPTRLWGKYVSIQYLRAASHDIHYASCLFSMQVALAYLMVTKAKIALVSDIYDSRGAKLNERYVRLLQGNGTDGFDLLNAGQDDISETMAEDPIVVFGGCSYSETPESVREQLDFWIHRLPNLILACDTRYPQFPKISNDPKFDSRPIEPEEKILNRIIDRHNEIDGVAANNPSLFCLNHIHTSNSHSLYSEHTVPLKIPEVLRTH